MLLHLVMDEVGYWAYRLKLYNAVVFPQINWLYPITGFHKHELMKSNKNVLNYYLFKTWPISLTELALIVVALIVFLLSKWSGKDWLRIEKLLESLKVKLADFVPNRSKVAHEGLPRRKNHEGSFSQGKSVNGGSVWKTPFEILQQYVRGSPSSNIFNTRKSLPSFIILQSFVFGVYEAQPTKRIYPHARSQFAQSSSDVWLQATSLLPHEAISHFMIHHYNRVIMKRKLRLEWL